MMVQIFDIKSLDYMIIQDNFNVPRVKNQEGRVQLMITISNALDSCLESVW